MKCFLKVLYMKQYIDCERTGSCNSGAVANFFQCSVPSFNDNIVFIAD